MIERAQRLIRDLKRAFGLTPPPIPPSLYRYRDTAQSDNSARRYVARRSRGNIRLAMGKYTTKGDIEKARETLRNRRGKG